jgi:hypothetical protein
MEAGLTKPPVADWFHITNYGTRCTRSMRIFEARARGSSITLRDIVPDYALGRQSLKAPPTS